MAAKIATVDCGECGGVAEVRTNARDKTLYITCPAPDCRCRVEMRGAAAQAKLKARISGEPVETAPDDDGVFTPVEAVPHVVVDDIDKPSGDGIEKPAEPDSNAVSTGTLLGAGLLAGAFGLAAALLRAPR